VHSDKQSAKKKKESNFPPINISVAARREKTVGWQAEMRAKVFCKVSEAA
jgi:hypothetical protein